MSKFKEAFGQNLKFIRKSRHITQEKLCELIDLHTRQLSKIETGGHFPSSRTIEKILAALNISPRELFDFDCGTELSMTGSGPCYRAVHSGTTIYLHDSESKNIETFSIEDLNYTKLAKQCNRPITVEHVENGELKRTIIYYPNGISEIAKCKPNKEYEENLKFLTENSRKVAKDKTRAKFIKTAFKALEDSAALEELELMIAGMKMMKK